MKLCQLASGQSFSVTRHAETGFKKTHRQYKLKTDRQIWSRSQIDRSNNWSVLQL